MLDDGRGATMRQEVTTFRTLKSCIKELERFIRDGNHLETGRRFKKFGNLSSREVLGCWLLSAVLCHEARSEKIRICTDPQGGDGNLYDTEEKRSYPIEQVMVTRWGEVGKDLEGLILEQIGKKQNKGGKAYASGKILVVFLNRQGADWYPNRLAKMLPKKIDFDDVWVVGLQEVIDDTYLYNVTQLNSIGCPIWRVHIDKLFESWVVSRIQ